MGISGVIGRHARAARLLMGWSVELLATRSGASVEAIRAHEDDFGFSTYDSQLVELAFSKAGIRFRFWDIDGGSGVHISHGFLTPFRALEAGRGWLKWSAEKLVREADLAPGELQHPLSQVSLTSCANALKRGGCLLMRDKSGELRGVRAAERQTSGNYVEFTRSKPGRWE